MKKMIVFDIDGTLYDSYNDHIPEKTYEAIKELRKNPDHILVVATGRSHFNAKKFEDLFVHFDAFIFLNGLHIRMNDADFYRFYPEKAGLDRLIDSMRERNLVYGCFAADVEYISEHSEKVKADFAHVNLDLPEVKDIKEVEGVQQLYFFGTDEDQIFLRERHPEFKVMSWHYAGADIIPVEADKRNGIEQLLKYYDLTKDEVIAFGDAPNDIGMITFVGTGIAMGNGVSELKEVADYIANHINDDAIYEMCKQLDLI